MVRDVNAEAEKIIAQLELQPLPLEGGFFRQTWTSSARLTRGRAASSAICFLLTADSFSAFHRIKSEELWHFYAGDPVEHVQLLRSVEPGGAASSRASAPMTACVNILGFDILAGQTPQLAVPGGTWQGARLQRGKQPRGWALLGCTVTPAWADEEFELGLRDALGREFPRETDWVTALTR